MTTIALNTLAATLGIPGTRLVDSTIVATPWRGDESVARVVGPDIIFPDGVTVTLEDGVPTPGPLELVPNDGTWCWRITVLAQRPRARLTRYVTVPDQSTVEFGDLIEVDPHTFAPSAVAVAAWEAVIAQVEAAMATIQDGTDGREVELGVSATHIQWRYVGEPAWTDLIALEDLKGDPGAPGDPGRYQYADSTEFLADTQTRDGVILAPTGANWQVDLGSPIPNNYVGPVLTRTQTMTIAGTVVTGQWVTLGSSTNTPSGLTYWRRKSGAGAWSTWSNSVYGALTPTGNYELASKYYVDERSVSVLANYAALDALTDASNQFGKVNIADITASLGVPGYAGIGGLLWFESVVNWGDGTGGIWGAWYQTVTFPDRETGDILRATRRRLYTTGTDWDAWGAWELEEPPAAGVKLYATTAEVNAVVGNEQGMLRLGNQTELRAFFGAAGNNMYFGADVLIESYLSDGYGSGIPPAGSGRLQQVATINDGYGVVYMAARNRGYNSSTGVWAAWGAWATLPVPSFRPNASNGTGLWMVSPNADGVGDGFAYLLQANQPTAAGQNEPGMWDRVAQVWATWFNDASRQSIEGGELRMRSAGFDFQGILDGARTDVGSVAFAARAAQTSQQTNRVEALAAAAAVDAVAGFHIPIGITNRFGQIFHATFAMTGGVTASTRLLCGLVATADVALAMADNEPSAMQNFFAAGYGASDAAVSVFQKATGSLASAALTGAAPSTSATAQLIDFRAFVTPNSGSLRYILGVRDGSAVYRATGTLGSNPANSLPFSFFLRASAGGASAQPKVALHRLRVGAGFGGLGGF